MTAKIHSTITAGLAALLGLCAAAALVMLGYRAMYDGRIYPGVSVRGVELGGLTVEEAASVMADRLPDGAAQTIELRAGEQSWQLSRAEAGQACCYANTAAAAYEVARSGLWYERLAAPWRVRF
ncbi:MAG: hypothetical protein U9R72_15855, partial [Chloroflexota bacterium]|nr:hypothetical protein [Chloroflexota bacterium]